MAKKNENKDDAEEGSVKVPDVFDAQELYRKAAEAYSEAVLEKANWTDEAKARLEHMQTAYRDLQHARTGQTNFGAFDEEEL